jgi:hypothetical protein
MTRSLATTDPDSLALPAHIGVALAGGQPRCDCSERAPASWIAWFVSISGRNEPIINAMLLCDDCAAAATLDDAGVILRPLLPASTTATASRVKP